MDSEPNLKHTTRISYFHFFCRARAMSKYQRNMELTQDNLTENKSWNFSVLFLFIRGLNDPRELTKDRYRYVCGLIDLLCCVREIPSQITSWVVVKRKHRCMCPRKWEVKASAGEKGWVNNVPEDRTKAGASLTSPKVKMLLARVYLPVQNDDMYGEQGSRKLSLTSIRFVCYQLSTQKQK